MPNDIVIEKCLNRRAPRNPGPKKLYIPSEKVSKSHSCLDKVTRSGIKYAIAWVTYVLLGSWFFLYLEETYPPHVFVQTQEWTRFKDLVSGREVVDELLTLRTKLQKLCSHHSLNASFDDLITESKVQISLTNSSVPVIKMPEKWFKEAEKQCNGDLFESVPMDGLPEYSMVDAIYYTMTLVTTIGFGHISPLSYLGRLFCIPYALVGVPLTCILMAKNSEMLSNRMLRIYESVRKRTRFTLKRLLWCVTIGYLAVGFLFFMFLPSVAFVQIEGWTYLDAVYFTFITLSTIGFGDLIAGYNVEVKYAEFYKMAIVVWIMLALGYWVLLLNFLQKAIKSNAKTLRRRFTKKKMAKHADFLKQLMTKVKTESHDSSSSPEEKLHMMAIMVESLSRKGSFQSSSNPNCMQAYAPSTRSCSITMPLDHPHSAKHHMCSKSSGTLTDRLHLMAKLIEKNSSCVASTTDGDTSQDISEDEGGASDRSSLMTSEPKCESPVKFDDLLEVSVSVKTETLPGFEALVAQASNDPTMDEHLKKPIQSIGSGEKQITLPLRDVINLVLTVASLDSRQDNGSGSDCDTDNSKLSKQNRSIIEHSSKKASVTLLKNIFPSAGIRNTPSCSKDTYIQNTLSHYLDGYEEEKKEQFQDLRNENTIPPENLKQMALLV